MKTTLINFLLQEGGKATEEWGTKRVTQRDIKKALEVVSKATGISYDELSQNLLGTSRLTFQGSRKSSGDIDITLPSKNFSRVHQHMMQLVEQRGQYNTGTKVGSYAVDVGNGKLVQVDLMPSDSPELSKFMYFSSEGEKSKYPGAVRNIMLMTLATFILEDGKDFVIKDSDENVIARASRSLKLDVGLERLFKVAKKRKDGKGRVKSPEKVSPDDLDTELKDIDPSKIGTFDKTADIIKDPDSIAHFFFGKKVFAKDIMTAEQVAELINKKFTGSKLRDIKSSIRKQLEESEFEVPSEL